MITSRSNYWVKQLFRTLYVTHNEMPQATQMNFTDLFTLNEVITTSRSRGVDNSNNIVSPRGSFKH